MNEKLQQAIIASRAGQKRDAQHLLTQVLKENPGEEQAWFLLSHLVDSEQKQIAYLSKTLALNPNHEKARERLARLTTITIPSPASQSQTPLAARERPAIYPPAPTDITKPVLVEEETPAPILPVSTRSSDFVTQEKGDTLPAWMADDAEYLNLAEVTATETEAETVALAPLPPVDQADLPDWLQQPVSDGWTEPTAVEEKKEETAPAKAAKTIKPAARTPTPPARPSQAADQAVMLTRILVGLIIVAAIVFVLLIYFAIQAF